MTIYLAYLSASLATFALTYLFYRILSSWRIVDVPNSRSSHLSPVPRGGGIAIVIAFFSTLILSGLSDTLDGNFSQALIYGGISIALIGFSDDICSLNPIIRFAATSLVTILCVLHIGTPSVSFIGFTLQSAPILFICEVLAILWILNLYNFMDGIDAITSVETISVVLIAAILLLLFSAGDESSGKQVEVLLLIAFSTAGFLIWNWPPARVFMGDVSSSFLGFILALFAVQTSVEQTMNVWVWLILLGVFFMDATVTVIRRILNKETFYKAHRQHIYQRFALYLQETKGIRSAAARTYAHRTTSLIVAAINFLWLAPWAYMAMLYAQQAMLFAFISLTPLLVLLILAHRKLPLEHTATR